MIIIVDRDQDSQASRNWLTKLTSTWVWWSLDVWNQDFLLLQSRQFLQGKELICGLVSDPGVVLDYVRLVIQTLQTFKEEYNRVRTQLKNQKQV